MNDEDDWWGYEYQSMSPQEQREVHKMMEGAVSLDKAIENVAIPIFLVAMVGITFFLAG